jgi:phosphorylcholine metabolism protein LicD
MLSLLDEFRLVVDVLEKEKIEYAICGGMAMAIHGFIRATVDIDIVLLQESIQKLKNIVRNYGYSIESNPMNFGNGNTIIHRVTKIDSKSEDFIVLDIIEVTNSLKEVWKNRIRVDWNYGSISVIDRKGLIDMKKMRNSKLDQEDIERLVSNE